MSPAAAADVPEPQTLVDAAAPTAQMHHSTHDDGNKPHALRQGSHKLKKAARLHKHATKHHTSTLHDCVLSWCCVRLPNTTQAYAQSTTDVEGTHTGINRWY